MQRLRSALVCALLVALTGAVVYGCILVRATTHVIETLPVVAERQIREQGEASRQAAMSAIEQTRREALKEIARTRADLLTRVDRLTDAAESAIAELTARADTQLGTLNATVAANLGRANESLASVSATAEAVRPALDNAGGITAQVNGALPLFLDCDHNPDCVFNRYG